MSALEIARLYGNGVGDFNTRNIDFSYSSNLEIPKIITLKFQEDGFPIKINPISIGDMNITNGSLNNLNPTTNDGVYTVELTPTDQNGTLDMNFTILGNGISTSTFGNSFFEISEIIHIGLSL